MYGLIGVSILTLMLAVLATASHIGIPASLPSSSILALIFAVPSLIISAVLFIIIRQRNAFTRANTALGALQSFMRYVLLGILATILLLGSAWQALTHYQRAEAARITQTMRVTAWVTIEGISDSVYDASPYNDNGDKGNPSGYRQVAVLHSVSPLVSNVTAQDLDKATTDYLQSDKVNTHSQANQAEDKAKNTTYRILLTAYPNYNKKSETLNALNNLQPGDQVLMSLTLAPLKTSQEVMNNASGFDSYRWLRARHIDGVGNIMAIGTSVHPTADYSASTTASSYIQRLRMSIDQGRWQLRQHFYQNWAQDSSAEQQARAVTLSLLTGDRSLINRETKDLYQLAGISHLLAISGTHVLFLAIVLSGLVTLIFDKKCATLYRYVPRWQLRWLVMVGAAFIYALFTGFDVPAARTAWMLLAVGAVRLTLLPVSTLQVLLALAVIMAWDDPYVLWQAGYWLSFIAVALLLKYEDSAPQAAHKDSLESSQMLLSSANHGEQQENGIPLTAQLGRRFKQLLKLQVWLFIALLPITLLLFGKASLWGLVINLFAIGLFGWIIVPLNLLAGLCYLVAPLVADGIWAIVIAIVAGLHELILTLTSLPALKGAWLYTPFNTAMLLMALLVVLPWLLPRGLLSRWLALPPLVLLMTTLFANQQALTLTPTLYILPTSDRYVTAALLQYPVSKGNSSAANQNKSNESVSWLLLADHRPQGERSMPSNLTADKLSASLEQQLRTLAVQHLEGIVVQTQVPALTKIPALPLAVTNTGSVKKQQKSDHNASLLLPLTVAQLTQNLPTNNYWQAGRSERWTDIAINDANNNTTRQPAITAQRCEQDKKWQLPNGALTLQVLTGWSQIDDSSVWDCSLAIDSTLPIKIVHYNPSTPQQSPDLTVHHVSKSSQTNPDAVAQKSRQNPAKATITDSASASRLIVDASTHSRVWQLWALLCAANPIANTTDTTANNNLNYSKPNFKQKITWFAHSASQVSAEALAVQPINDIVTYNDVPLPMTLSLTVAPLEE